MKNGLSTNTLLDDTLSSKNEATQDHDRGVEPFYFQEDVNPGNIPIPPPTTWEHVCPGSSCPFVRISDTNQFYCCYWQVSLFFPILISLLMLYCYFIYLLAVLPRIQFIPVQILSVFEVTFSVSFFFWTYFGAVFGDPGYLPFDWITSQKSKYTWREIMNGTATRKDQFSYVDSIPRPPLCSFSKSSGRYIIRADHFCSWIANWVGKRNHKQFVLFPFWGFVAVLSLTGWRFVPMIKINGKSQNASLKEKSFALFVMEIVALVIEVMNDFVLILVFVSNVMEISDNRTMIQKYKNIKAEKVSKTEAMEVICGNGSSFFWICPTAAFPDDIELFESNIEIANACEDENRNI